jgi:SAM-dependent methyltransferase
LNESIAAYWNKRISVLADSYSPGSAGFRRTALAKRFILKIQDQGRYDSILDCGCGTGHSLEVLAPLFDESFGTDISDKMLETARASTCLATPPTLFIWDICRPFPIRDWQHVDVVTLFSVLPYVEDWTPFFRELKKVLRPGGAFIATFPNKLFDMYSLNTLTASFFSQELIDKNISKEIGEVTLAEFGGLFSGRSPKFKEESAYSAASLYFKRLNPITIASELSKYGVSVDAIHFMNNHPVPPSFKSFDEGEISAIRMERELDLNYSHWSQFFTNSTFMVEGKFQPIT